MITYNYNNMYKKKHKLIQHLCTKHIHINSNTILNIKYNFHYKQQHITFYKNKFGLYKNINFFEKRIKNNIVNVLNYIKYNETTSKKKDKKKKHRIFFAKKFNKLFFRAGRGVLINKLNIKKHVIQKYISKKITHLIKKNHMYSIRNIRSNILLIKCGLFYTLKDSNTFINMFGVAINSSIVYDITTIINPNDYFSIIWTKYLFKYLKKKKKQIIFNLKKIKLYKFRMKQYLTKKKIEWVPITTWLLDYSCLYISKYSNIEFDIKTLTGFLLYNLDLMENIHYFNYTDIGLYMARSYNWKYIV